MYPSFEYHAELSYKFPSASPSLAPIPTPVSIAYGHYDFTFPESHVVGIIHYETFLD